MTPGFPDAGHAPLLQARLFFHRGEPPVQRFRLPVAVPAGHFAPDNHPDGVRPRPGPVPALPVPQQRRDAGQLVFLFVLNNLKCTCENTFRFG